MKSVLISIQPKWCELIASGEKTIEVRKTRPKIETPFKCYIYETAGKTKYWSQPMPIPYKEGRCKVIGEFVCDRIYSFIFLSTDGGNADRRRQYYLIGENDKIIRKFWRESCIQPEELAQYIDQEESCYGWHISDLKIYDKPKELGEFRKCDIYCGDCKHIVLPTDRLSLSDCDRRCDKFNKDLLFYDSFNRCEECLELNTITRPPQSWCYVEE